MNVRKRDILLCGASVLYKPHKIRKKILNFDSHSGTHCSFLFSVLIRFGYVHRADAECLVYYNQRFHINHISDGIKLATFVFLSNDKGLLISEKINKNQKSYGFSFSSKPFNVLL